MSNTLSLRTGYCALLLGFGAIQVGLGQTFLGWDTNTSVAGAQGGTGTWASNRWWTGSGNIVWVNGAAALFAGTAGTVTLNTAVTAAGMGFGTSGYTLGGSGSVTLDGATTPELNAVTGTATIGLVLNGSMGLAKTGTGTLFLTGANTYTGTTRINEGTLSTPLLGLNGATSGLGAGTGVTLDSGTLRYTGPAAGSDAGSGFNRNIQVNTTYSGGVTVDAGFGALLQPAAAAGLSLTGNLGGGGTLTVTGGAADVRLGGDSAAFAGKYSHGTAGTTVFAAAAAGSANAEWELTGNANAALHADVPGTPTILLGSLSGGSGRVGNRRNDSTATFAIGGRNIDCTFGGSISDAGGSGSNGITALTKTGTARLTLTGINTFTGPVRITIGSLAGGGSAGGQVNVTQSFAVGSNHASTVFGGNLTGGSRFTKVGTGSLTLTSASGTLGQAVADSGTLAARGIGAALEQPAESAPVFRVESGTLTLRGEGVFVGFNRNTTGVLEMAGGVLDVDDGDLRIGNTGPGRVVQTGGAISLGSAPRPSPGNSTSPMARLTTATRRCTN